MRLRLLHFTVVLGFAMGGGLTAQIPDFTPATPLVGALMHNNTAEAKRLLANGANPNEAPFLVFPAVFVPVMNQNRELFQAMVEKGADLQARDASGSTALMWAAANENADTALVDDLLKLGLDPNARNKAGETALTWASRRGNTKVVAILEKAGASNAAAIRNSAERAIALLQETSPRFVRVSGCVSCHNQFLPQMAVAAARSHGVRVEDKPDNLSPKGTIAMVAALKDEIAKSSDRFPDPPVSVGYALLGLSAANYPADETTDLMADLIAKHQNQDGGFRAFTARPPIEGSHFTATALSLRGLQIYGKDSEVQVARARAWLLEAEPRSNEDRAMQILGLSWGNAEPEAIAQRARALLAEQRPDGGWAQLPGIETDAYATGQALVALSAGARIPLSDPAYKAGVAYLLRTQAADGSWLVRTRTFPVQPIKESGFPYGKDQWISAAGTSWAATALALALPEPEQNQPRLFAAAR
jgi:Ankyrin repeats (3 copies)/Prenyltransferase and squalene oxidase repeat